jgi:hypothetical protein
VVPEKHNSSARQTVRLVGFDTPEKAAWRNSRKRGGQPKNQNALKHGRNSATCEPNAGRLPPTKKDASQPALG